MQTGLAPGLNRGSATEPGTWPRFRRFMAKNWEAYAMLFPVLAGFVAFSGIPLVTSIYLGFAEWDVLTSPRWVGPANYVRLSQDLVFYKVLGNTALYAALFVFPSLILALLLAMLANKPLRGITAFRVVYFIPVITSLVVVIVVFRWLYSPTNGALAYFARLFEQAPPLLLESPQWAMPAITAMAVWKALGYYMVIYLAGLQSIPDELVEAAKIDGAGRWAIFVNVTLPVIQPVTLFIAIIATIGALQVFTIPNVMTKGGPAQATATIVYQIYQSAFFYSSMGYAAAMSYVLFVITLGISLLQAKLFGFGRE